MVGAYSDGTTNKTLIVHWNGAAWRQQPSPNPGSVDNILQGVAATSATNAWAVGYYDNGPGTVYKTLIVHWNGRGCKRVASPNQRGCGNVSVLEAVTAISAKNAWAVGYDSGGARPCTGTGTPGSTCPARVFPACYTGWQRLRLPASGRSAIPAGP